MSDEPENRPILPQDPQAYRKPIAGTFRRPLPGGFPGDRDIKASPYLIKALLDREWIEKNGKK
jgi:hypothetical protein